MNTDVIKLIEKCISERCLVTLTDDGGLTLEQVVPVLCDRDTVHVVMFGGTIGEFNNVIEAEQLGPWPKDKRLLPRKYKPNLKAVVQFDNSKLDVEVIDLSPLGLGLRLETNLLKCVPPNIPVYVTISGRGVKGLTAYHNQSLSRIGVKLEFSEGKQFESGL